jgi:hypothetical protein
LERGLSDEGYSWFEIPGAVKLQAVLEQSAVRAEGRVWLNVLGGRLEWSVSSSGKSGFFNFRPPGSLKYSWEFAACDVSRLEDLAGKPMRVKFYGEFTPGRDTSALGANSPGGIVVKTGQVVLARNTIASQRIVVIRVESAVSIVSVRMAVIENSK